MRRTWTFRFLTVILLIQVLHAVKFNLQAMPNGVQEHNRVCFSEYANKGSFVRGEYEVTKVLTQTVSLEVFDSTTHRNQYFSKLDLDGPGKFVFTTHDHAAIFICFQNNLQQGVNPSPESQRVISFQLKTGADAKDDDSFQVKDEHLKPVEISLRRLQSIVTDIVDEQDHLKSREEKLRDINGIT
ncbi:vesicle coat component [Coelomomyces lativittatus]|nr:vesicle coat component [Coelomomyces lativittatus]KAJ1505297.1 vesicle coat component [Coelomomyces lativittatus]KAJ1512794.1 vesicle coat component [Coelomomyces lativittatus]